MSERFLCEFKGMKMEYYVVCYVHCDQHFSTIPLVLSFISLYILSLFFYKIVSKFVLVVNLIYIFAHGIFTRVYYYYAYCYFYDIVIEP